VNIYFVVRTFQSLLISQLDVVVFLKASLMPTWGYIKIHTLQAEKERSGGGSDGRERISICTAQTMAGHDIKRSKRRSRSYTESRKGV
jgi:hypothetical protein